MGDVFVHRKNVVGSTSAHHLDLQENGRISFRLGEQDGKARALEATMLDLAGKVHPMHSDLESLSLLDEGDENRIQNDNSRVFIHHIKSTKVQQCVSQKRGRVEAWL